MVQRVGDKIPQETANHKSSSQRLREWILIRGLDRKKRYRQCLMDVANRCLHYKTSQQNPDLQVLIIPRASYEWPPEVEAHPQGDHNGLCSEFLMTFDLHLLMLLARPR